MLVGSLERAFDPEFVAAVVGIEPELGFEFVEFGFGHFVALFEELEELEARLVQRVAREQDRYFCFLYNLQ